MLKSTPSPKKGIHDVGFRPAGANLSPTRSIKRKCVVGSDNTSQSTNTVRKEVEGNTANASSFVNVASPVDEIGLMTNVHSTEFRTASGDESEQLRQMVEGCENKQSHTHPAVDEIEANTVGGYMVDSFLDCDSVRQCPQSLKFRNDTTDASLDQQHRGAIDKTIESIIKESIHNSHMDVPPTERSPIISPSKAVTKTERKSVLVSPPESGRKPSYASPRLSVQKTRGHASVNSCKGKGAGEQHINKQSSSMVKTVGSDMVSNRKSDAVIRKTTTNVGKTGAKLNTNSSPISGSTTSKFGNDQPGVTHSTQECVEEVGRSAVNNAIETVFARLT